MTNEQRNYLMMAKQMKQFLLGWKDITDNLFDFPQPFGEYCNTITQIEAVAVLQEKNTKVIKMSKDDIRASLIEAMLVIFRRCKRYATVNEKTEFLELIKMSEPGLNKLADEDLMLRCRNFIVDVTEKLAELANVNVKADDFKLWADCSTRLI